METCRYCDMEIIKQQVDSSYHYWTATKVRSHFWPYECSKNNRGHEPMPKEDNFDKLYLTLKNQ